MRPHRKRPARRKVAQQTASTGVSAPRAGRTPPRANRPKAQPNYSADGGISFVTVLMGVVAAALAAFVVMILMPADLESVIDGYHTAPTSDSEPRNLLPEMQDVAIDMSKSIELSEAELNQYLALRLKGEQKGTFGGLVKYAGTYVDLRPGVAEFYIERKMFGMPLTMSCEVRRLGDEGERETWKIGGGSIGKLRMSELSFAPILKPFLRMSQTAVDDMDVLKAVSRIEFQDAKATLGRKS